MLYCAKHNCACGGASVGQFGSDQSGSLLDDILIHSVVLLANRNLIR